MSTSNKVLVRQGANPRYEELPINGTLYPTYLAKISEVGGVTKLEANNVQGAPCLVVREDEHGMGGNSMGTLITTACTGRATAAYLDVGDMIVVTVVDSLAVNKGDLLTSSATAGKVGALINTTLSPVAVASQPSTVGAVNVVSAQLVLRAEEALASGATTRRILCRVLRG
jgi:hypothetical protein